MRKANEFDQYVGKKIKLLRKAKGMKGIDLAKKLAISPQQLYKYEEGKDRLSIYKFHLIVLALNCSIMDFDIGYYKIDKKELQQKVENQVL